MRLLFKYLLLVLLFLQAMHGFGRTVYVAPDGSDSATGTLKYPFESISRAQQSVGAGDTVYIRGGSYSMREGQIAAYKDIWAYVTVLDKSGTTGKRICYFAYPGEQPVFDFSNIKPAGKRVIAFYLTASNIHIRGIEIVGVQVTIKTHTQSECFEVKGSYNIIENVSMHDGMAIGVYLLEGSYNLVLNCDAYRNYDPVSEDGRGGNVDGFGAHLSEGSRGNIFKGCRAWFNSDDGFDLINSHEPVLIDSCQAFYNGYSPGFISRGDGNGFKCGGYGSTSPDRLPDVVPVNTIRFCLAVGNKQSGFYANHHPGGNKWYNNTAYRNKRNYNMLNREGTSQETYLVDVPGWGHHMVNNLGFGATYAELSNIDKLACELENNYFDLKLKADQNDFISLDEALLTASRAENGTLPETGFLQLVEGSDLIDQGIDIGFSFNGTAPDLGCYESSVETGIGEFMKRKPVFNIFPNPLTDRAEVVFELEHSQHVSIGLYALSGKRIKQLTDANYKVGRHVVSLNGLQLPGGSYCLLTHLDHEPFAQKIMIVK
ncbi:right-handed parallel beta-helix repeat-containing protein [Roseimarinus sediminis]|uniref:right-handed parallel beta-helix repeat-containing protein n=1 Tax=Roseimarinus sediminis TaxID=1610899 RepID=UPI003D23BCB8